MTNNEISNFADLIFVEVDCSQDVFEVEADRKNHFFNVKYVSKEVVKNALRKYERVAIFNLDKSLEAKNFIR